MTDMAFNLFSAVRPPQVGEKDAPRFGRGRTSCHPAVSGFLRVCVFFFRQVSELTERCLIPVGDDGLQSVIVGQKLGNDPEDARDPLNLLCRGAGCYLAAHRRRLNRTPSPGGRRHLARGGVFHFRLSGCADARGRHGANCSRRRPPPPTTPARSCPSAARVRPGFSPRIAPERSSSAGRRCSGDS